MNRALFATASIALSLLASACGPKNVESAKKAEFTGPARNQMSSSKDRSEVSVTVYNSNFGLVREIREMQLGTGKISLEYGDVAAQIQPETVHIRSLTGADALTILEQNYRYDLLSPAKLLEKYVGKKVKLWRWNEAAGKDDILDAEVLSVEGGPIFKIGDQITYGFPGRVSFPEVPANLIAKPTLVWLLGSTVPKQKVEVTYLTGSMSWRADYVFVIDDKDTVGDLTGWVTLNNTSGTSYEDAKLKLVAGDVQKIAPPEDYDGYADDMPMAAAEAPAPSFKEEGLFEYHMYTLQRQTSLLQNEQKQVTLLEGKGVKIDKKLLFFGNSYYYRGSYGQVMSNQKVGVYLDVQNTEANHLGIPLPKGIVRVYKADKSGAQQFIGEDRIDHTPRDEKIRVKMGDAFDVVGDRKQMQWKSLGSCTSESSWEIQIRNHKDTAETVEIFEPVGGDWTIVNSSHPAKKIDAHTFSFEVKPAARSDVKVTYRVRIKWC